MTHSFVWSFFLSPARSLSLFFSSLTRSLVLGSLFHYLVRSFVSSPVRSFLRSCARCLFSYSLVRAWFIRLFSHPFARSRGRTFVVFSLTRSFVLGWFVCSLTRLLCSVLRYLSVTIVTLYPVRHDRYMIVKVHSYVKVVLLIPSTVLWI